MRTTLSSPSNLSSHLCVRLSCACNYPVCSQIERNSFIGTIPTEVGGLTEMTFEWCASDHARDAWSWRSPCLKAELFYLGKHRWMDSTEMSGTLPTQIGKLVRLGKLYAAARLFDDAEIITPKCDVFLCAQASCWEFAQWRPPNAARAHGSAEQTVRPTCTR